MRCVVTTMNLPHRYISTGIMGVNDMERSTTYIATAPGATIKEQLEYRGMSQKEFAARMDMSEKYISNLMNGEALLTPKIAVELERVLGVPTKFWNSLEAIYREKLVKIKDENA